MNCDVKRTRTLLVCLALVLLVAAGVAAQTPDPLLREMRWRNVGPASFAGRVVDVEAVETDFRHVVVASASGGVWKSVNAGTTWEPIFDSYASASIGDVAIFQRDPSILWVGTGEANNRNSVAWGDGVYKSTDGGKSFQNVGLRDTYQIARIVAHPTDPNLVYVAAIGNLWGYTGDRGLFMTNDGGKTWTKLTNGLPGDNRTGAIDLAMDPANPKVLYAAFYQRLRRPWRFDSGGANGGIFKSTDAGKSWTKLTNGLPSGDTGRIGLAVYRKNPKIVMAIVEHGFQPREADADYTDMSKLGTGIYRSEDAGKTWKFVNRYNNRPFYYSQIRIDPHDDQRVYVLTTTIRISSDGGRTFRPGGPSFEGGLDFHAMWHDPLHRGRYYLGKDKGLTLTQDDGATFVLFDNMPIAQFYALGVDLRDPYFIYGGTQDNGTWGGPHFSKDARGTQADSWWKLHWGDGMFIQVDPTDWRNLYTEAENGSFRRYDAQTRRVEPARPSRENIVNLAEALPGGQAPQFRFNWRSPLVISSHNPQTLYLGGNHLFRTVDRGRHWMIASPDLSTNDPVKTDTNTGGVTRDATGAETHCTITAFSESPRNPALLWAGTDDGNVQVTRNGGVTWSNVRKNIAGVPEGVWVSSVEASHFDEGTAYVSFDGHRSDDFTTWVFRTTDYGATWTRITSNLPEKQPVLVVREDPRNRNLLYLGTEFAVFVSLDAGARWTRLMNNMPTVAVHDLVVHPRDNDLIAGTHGRGIWVLDDVTPLQQSNDRVLAATAHLFEQRPATIWEDASRGGARGHFFFAAENPPYIPKRANVVRSKLESGALISYYLKAAPGSATVEITDVTGQKKRTLSVSREPGINRAVWDLRWDPTAQQVAQFVARMTRALETVSRQPDLSAEQKALASSTMETLKAAKTAREVDEIMTRLEAGFPEVEQFADRPRGEPVEPAEYLLRLTVDGASYPGKIVVRRDPMLGGAPN